MEVDSHDPKNMSLADIIKQDKSKPSRGGKGMRGGKSLRGRPESGRGGRGGSDRQGGRPRFGSNEFKNKKKDGQNPFKAKRTGNMISKQGDRPRFENRRVKDTGGERDRRILNKTDSRRGGFRARGGAQVRPERGGLARGPRKVLTAPKKQKTLKIGGDDKQAFTKTKTLRPSDVRLKVRNIDEKQVTNDDLKKLFAKIGDLKVCRFDRNEFG